MGGRLDGKDALVTGGTTGLGFAIAGRFAREGARVVITGRDERLGVRAEEQLRESGAEVWFLRADAASREEVRRSVDEAVARLGGLDVLVNNAGVGIIARVLDTPEDDYDRVMDVNVRGYFLYAKAAYRHLAARRGSMIHISSDAGVTGEQSIGAYSVSKAAVVMLSKMLALDGAPDGVRSNCVCPGDVVPGMRHMARRGEEPEGERWQDWPLPPLGRLGEPKDVADAAVFFASEESSFCTGAVLLVDGGAKAGIRI